MIMKLEDYIGLKYAPGGRGPEAFDCWGLVMFYTKETQGKQLPDQVASPSNIQATIEAFKLGQQLEEWVLLEQPKDGCIVTAGRNKYLSHAGVMIGTDLVLHASRDAGAVCLQRLSLFKRQWSLVMFCEHAYL